MLISEFKVGFGNKNTMGEVMQEAYSRTRRLSDDLLLALLIFAKQNDVSVVSTGLGISGAEQYFSKVLGNTFARFHRGPGPYFDLIPTGHQIPGRNPDELVDVKILLIHLEQWDFTEEPWAHGTDRAMCTSTIAAPAVAQENTGRSTKAAVFLAPGKSIEEQEESLRVFFAATPMGGFITDLRIAPQDSNEKTLFVIMETRYGQELRIRISGDPAPRP